jgi:putative restriction endonuclease
VRAYVGVTDTDWRQYLAARPDLTEVNFWQPSGGSFAALSVGEPFFFKSKYPDNQLIGGGFFSGFALLTVAEAWEIYGEGNGVASLAKLAERIRRYRRDPVARLDARIGCVALRDVAFFDAPEAAPDDWSPNLVKGKRYDLETADEHLQRAWFRLLEPGVYGRSSLPVPTVGGPMWGDPRLAPNRLGQQSFKALVLAAYERRCAITGAKVRPVLQAAHIRPVTQGGDHRLDNGLLLRADVHIMFDRGYLGVDSQYRLMVSPKLREEFGNGEQFYAKARTEIAVPAQRNERPSREFLEWHRDEVFLAH